MISRMMLIAGLLASVGLWTGCGRTDSESTRVVVTGASTIAPMLGDVARHYKSLHPGIRVDVQTGGSSRGIADARRGLAHIGMVSRAAYEDEDDLLWHKIARDGIAMIVHADNPIREIDTDTVRAIYRKEIRRWSELGGPGPAHHRHQQGRWSVHARFVPGVHRTAKRGGSTRCRHRRQRARDSGRNRESGCHYVRLHRDGGIFGERGAVITTPAFGRYSCLHGTGAGRGLSAVTSAASGHPSGSVRGSPALYRVHPVGRGRIYCGGALFYTAFRLIASYVCLCLSPWRFPPPQVHSTGGVTWMAPVDPHGGGTWIWTNQHRLTACIMNAYETRSESDSARCRSRGLFLQSLAPCSDMATLAYVCHDPTREPSASRG